ncbi:uncharacterized protein V6R79_018912 [Siganus canaliculatus]
MKLSSKPSALFPLLGVMLLWPDVLTRSISSSVSMTMSAGQGEERPHVAKRSTQMCDSSFDQYCLNNGQCMLLVDVNEHHCVSGASMDPGVATWSLSFSHWGKSRYLSPFSV